MHTLYLIIFFITGTIFGSFFNVVAYRLSNNLSLIKPSSHCEHCNHKLKWYELIPLISYIIQKGKCRKCKEKLSKSYITVELITGILFATCYNEFALTVDLIIAIIFVSTLIIIIVSDIEYMIILDEVLFIGCILILLTALFFEGFQTAFNMIVSGILSFSVMYLIKIIGDFLFKKESLGGGDIKLMFLFGLVLEFEMAVVAIFLGTFLAFPISLYILVKRKDNMIPFGPFLSIAAILILITKLNLDKIISWFA